MVTVATQIRELDGGLPGASNQSIDDFTVSLSPSRQERQTSYVRTSLRFPDTPWQLRPGSFLLWTGHGNHKEGAFSVGLDCRWLCVYSAEARHYISSHGFGYILCDETHMLLAPEMWANGTSQRGPTFASWCWGGAEGSSCPLATFLMGKYFKT